MGAYIMWLMLILGAIEAVFYFTMGICSRKLVDLIPPEQQGIEQPFVQGPAWLRLHNVLYAIYHFPCVLLWTMVPALRKNPRIGVPVMVVGTPAFYTFLVLSVQSYFQ